MSIQHPTRRFRFSAVVGWWPELVAAMAILPGWPGVWCIGTGACVLQTLAIAATLNWMDEPFPDLATYLRRAVTALPCALPGLLVLWGSIFAVLAATGESKRFPRLALLARLVCVCPLATVIPGVLWSICAFMASLAINLIPGQGPAWLGSPIIRVMGSPLWLFVGCLLMIANAVAALPIARSALRARAAPTCGTCGYDLTGNVSGVCPECGEPVARVASVPPISMTRDGI